ncbi:MAG: T9SS type A sorting domain-containing protein [Flavobacteriales bacterium]|nr:T9SS type A sorting domain-containing protein [Flavobacteriales bacterium]
MKKYTLFLMMNAMFLSMFSQLSNVHIITDTLVQPMKLIHEDVEGDGDKDILFADLIGNYPMTWLENDGTPSYNAVPLSDTASYYHSDIALGDLNGDGEMDLVCAKEGRICYYPGNGSTYQFPRTISYISANKIHLTDLDLDGDSDIVFSVWAGEFPNTGGGVLYVENLGSNNFGSSQFLKAGPYDYSVGLIDINGDNLKEIAISGNDSLFMLTNNQNLNFSSQLISTNMNGYGGVIFHAFDLDNDGDEDLLTAKYFGDEISVFNNNGGNFTETSLITLDGPISFDIGDLNADGTADIVACAKITKELSWFDGSQNYAQNLITDTLGNIFDLHLVDIDTDNDMDLLWASATGTIGWLQNTSIITSVHDIDSKSLSVFPNPTSGEIYLNSAQEIDQLFLFDSKGRVIKEWTKHQVKSQLALPQNLAKGQYLLKSFSKERTDVVKLLHY